MAGGGNSVRREQALSASRRRDVCFEPVYGGANPILCFGVGRDPVTVLIEPRPGALFQPSAAPPPCARTRCSAINFR